MSIITELRTSKRSAKQVNLYVDGKYTVSLGTFDVAKEGLKVGQELSSDRLETLLTALHKGRCLDAAYRYLGYRQRSESELRERLVRRSFTPEEIDSAIVRLKEQGLLDDAAFARVWAENRQSFSPRSQRATGRELREKGIADTIVKEVVGEIDETEAAYRAAATRAKRLASLDYEHFYRKIGDYLKYRGFGYEVISRTIKRVWQEIKENKEKELPSS